MCRICRKEYNINTEFINCCGNIKIIPKELIKLKYLYCYETQIGKIPKTLIKLENLYCENTQIKKLPKTLIKLNTLYCNNSQIKKIPETLINLETFYFRRTQIKFIPKTLINLKYLYFDNDVLVSPQTYIIEPNNKYYLTFTRCQVRYKIKLRLNKLKFAYDPNYIIGHNAKKQLERIFQN